METIINVKKQVASYKVKYMPLNDPLDPKLNAMISHDGHLQYSASCSDGIISVYCKKEDVELIRDNLEDIIKDNIAMKLWLALLKDATPQELHDLLDQ